MRARVLQLAVLVLLPALCIAQPSSGVEITPMTAQVDRLNLADVDFLHATTPKWLFTLQLRILSGQTAEAQMDVAVSISLANGESFSNAFAYSTVPFAIPGIRTFTNFDLQDPKLKSEYRTDEAAKKRLEQMSLSSGTLPAGVYSFAVTVNLLKENKAYQQATSRFQFVLSNPSLIDLILPVDEERSAGRYPLFQWNFDGKGSRLSVYEKLPSHSSLEEATSGIPHLVTELSSTSYLYPAAGVRPLEPGKTYVWFVEGLYGTSGGAGNTIRSKLRSFTVATGSDPTLLTILDELERAMGSKYKTLFDLIRAGDLSPTGVIRMNGVPVTTVDLLRYVNQIRNDPDAVLSAGLE
jgi:hypothetical protein